MGESLARGMMLAEPMAADRAPEETCLRHGPRAALTRPHKAAPEPHNRNHANGAPGSQFVSAQRPSWRSQPQLRAADRARS